MQKQLLLFFLIVTCQLQAQREYALRPFEDYTNCTTGFLNERGDTIWPAQFDRVLKPINNQSEPAQCWIAVYYGNYGLLSVDGAIILPFEYAHIEMSFEKDVYLVHKDQKIGIYNKEGKEIYPIQINSIEAVYDQSMVYEENGKFGLFSSGMQPTLKPIYSYIELFEFPDYNPFSNKRSDIYYFLQKDNLFGLSDANGTVLFDNACCPFEFLNHPIYSKYPLLRIDSDKGSGMITLQNELLVAPENRDLNLFTLNDLKGDTLLYAYIERDTESKKVIRIDQKRESQAYENLIIGSHALLFSRKNKKGFLNTNLEEQIIKTPYNLRFGAHSLNYSEEMNYGTDLPFIPGSKDQCVLVVSDTETKGKNHYVYDKSYGLINVITGAKVKPQFHMIYSKFVGDKVYYFAFEQWLQEDVNSTFTVYNSDLEIQGSYQMNNQRMMNFNEFFLSNKEHKAFIFMNEQGKLGAVAANGKIVIPFIYDELHPQYLDIYNQLRPERLAARIDKKNGTIDWTGKELIPVEFDFVQPFQDNFQIAAKPNGYILYDSVYRKVIQDCQYITVASSHSLKFYNRSGESYYRDNTFYAVKKDIAYAYFEDEFKVLNEQNILHDQKNNDLTHVGGRLLIEKSGKCLLYKDYLLKASPSVYYFQQKDTMCVFHIKKGVTACMTRSTINPGIDAYLHINEYPTKEGLISKETGEWVLKPDGYFKILTDGKKGNHSTTDHFWYIMKGDEGLSNSMWIYDRLEKGKLERKFDVPVMSQCGEYILARSGGKYGLLDKNYSEVLPFAYKNIIHSHEQFFVKMFDNRWSAWTPERGLIPLNCTAISLAKYTNGRLIFDKDRVAILSDSFDLLLPFTDKSKLSDTISFVNLLGPVINFYDRHSRNYLFSDEYEPIGRIYNTTMIIELSLIFSTRHQVTEAPYLYNKTHSLQPVLVDEVALQMYERRTLSFIKKRIVSYQVNSVRRGKAEYLPGNIFRDFNSNNEVSSYRTFVLDGSLLREATLQDLFLENVNYTYWLDEYLTKVINQKQLFGLQCMNLPAILSEYKQNFHLEGGGISFSLANNHKAIVIPWGELKGKIKEM